MGLSVIGSTVPILEDFDAIYVGQGVPLPSRARALLDFLAERGKVS